MRTSPDRKRPTRRRATAAARPPDPPAAEAPTAATPAVQVTAARPRAAEAPVAEAPILPGGFAPLKTERLTLRPFRTDDAGELHRLINDFEIARMLELVAFPYDREMADKFIASAITDLAAGNACHLAITGHEGPREIIVGAAGLSIDRANRTGRLGYWVGRRFWGHGVATEAARKLSHWAFANLDINEIHAAVAEDNPASAAVLRRIGFRETGTGTRHFASRKADHPIRLFAATRDDLFEQPVEAADAAALADAGGKPLLLVAACALVDTDGRVLLARRPEGKRMAGLWEFPGGKLDPGETPEAGLIRELKEELGIDVTAACLAPFAFASHAYDRFHLLMPLFLCRRWTGTPRPREGQTLAWVRAAQLSQYEMPPADKPLIPLLRDFL